MDGELRPLTRMHRSRQTPHAQVGDKKYPRVSFLKCTVRIIRISIRNVLFIVKVVVWYSMGTTELSSAEVVIVPYSTFEFKISIHSRVKTPWSFLKGTYTLGWVNLDNPMLQPI